MIEFTLFLLKVLQLLHAFDLLFNQGRLALPRVVDVRPVEPLDEVLSLARLGLGVEVCIGIALIQHVVVRRSAATGCKVYMHNSTMNSSSIPALSLPLEWLTLGTQTNYHESKT